MSFNFSEDQTESKATIFSRFFNRKSIVWRIRIFLAVIVTLSLLPYLVGRTILVTMLTHSPEMFFLEAAIVVIFAINILTWKLSIKFCSNKERWILFLVLVLGWSAVSSALVYLRFSDVIPKYQVAMLFVPTTLASVWLSWMFFVPMKIGVRLWVTGLFIIPLVLFVTSFQVTGLSGEGSVEITWKNSVQKKIVEKSIVLNSTKTVSDSKFPNITQNDFPQFLGTDRTAVIQSHILEEDWSEISPRELWRKPAGGGWGSFAVVGHYAFTQEQQGSSECVVCYDVTSGKINWIHKDKALFEKSLGGDGPRATPTVHEGRLYAVGATGILNCFDALTGKVHWSKNILEENDGKRIHHGVSGSPLIVGSFVVVAPTGTLNKALVAYDRLTGKRVWTTGKSETSYGSPQLFNINGHEQILVLAHTGLVSYDVTDGKYLWDFPWSPTSGPNCTQPLLIPETNNELIISTGYGKGTARLRILKDEKGKWSVEKLWTSRSMKCKFSTPVIVGEYLYGLDDGILACIKLSDGKKMWKRGRYKHGQILLIGQRILILTERGKIVIVDPDSSGLKEVGKITALDAKTWNNPTLAGSFLIVRNSEEMICFDLASNSKTESTKSN